MRIREKINRFLMKKTLKSKIENLSQPGFISFGIGLGATGKELREVFLPEEIYSEIENRFEEEFGDEGAAMLYRAGRKYGWRYTDIAEFPENHEGTDKEVEKFVRFFSNYISTAYASKADFNFDIEDQTYELHIDKCSVCRQNGKGYTVSQGALSGVIARIYSNPDIHAVQDRCVGRDDKKCHVICSEINKLPVDPVSTFSDFNSKPLSRKYETVNEPRELEHTKRSLEELTEEGMLEYRENLLYHKDRRQVPMEISMPYFIDREAEEKEGAPLILFDVSYKIGKDLGEGEDLSYTTKYLGALGWGDINPVEDGEKIEINHFPWTIYSKNTDFNIFRGLISGMVSAIKDEEVRYNNYETNLSPNSFNLILKSEE